jgi:hypothetical protein
MAVHRWEGAIPWRDRKPECRLAHHSLSGGLTLLESSVRLFPGPCSQWSLTWLSFLKVPLPLTSPHWRPNSNTWTFVDTLKPYPNHSSQQLQRKQKTFYPLKTSPFLILLYYLSIYLSNILPVLGFEHTAFYLLGRLPTTWAMLHLALFALLFFGYGLTFLPGARLRP